MAGLHRFILCSFILTSLASLASACYCDTCFERFTLWQCIMNNWWDGDGCPYGNAPHGCKFSRSRGTRLREPLHDATLH